MKLKNMWKFVLRKKFIFISMFCCLIIAIAVIVPTINVSVKPNYEHTIVIDAGHGARDGGCVGVNGSIEKDLNLEYSKTLKKLLETKNLRVIMTRTNDKALYNEDANNKKLSEMKNRANIIMNYKPDLVISIHMNSFPLKSATGAKVYYKDNSTQSKSAGEKIQKSINYYCNERAYSAKIGDYYILNCTEYPSVLVECGYLSNPEEEAKLNAQAYREKLMHSVFCGIIVFLGYNYY